MADVIKLAQPGYDVTTAGDENLIYNSSWPTLRIYKQGSFTISDTSASDTLVIAEHDLQFPPMYWFFANTPINAYQNIFDVGIQSRSEFFGPVGDGSVVVSDSKLVYDPVSFPGTTSGSRLYYYLFALDLTKQFTAPIIKVGGISSGRAGDNVFKVVKENGDISSSRLKDFIIHSKARSPLIHSVNPSGGPTKEFTVTHDLGYLPMFFGYQKNASTGYYKLLPTGQGGSSSLQSTKTTVSFSTSSALEITIVILKDPFEASNSVQVKI